jgi:dissimilatory sulfite reductase (desulfoviridin) alpha/beta subunit
MTASQSLHPIAFRRPGVVPGVQPGYALGDGRFAVIVEPPLGRLSQTQRRGLVDIASRYAFGGLVERGIGRLEIRGVDPELVPLVVDEVHTAGLPVAGDRS